MHVYLYHALGWTPPAFAHVCLLARNAGEVENLHGKNMLPKTAPTKLSKRNMDDGLLSYQEQGADPQALLNFLALLGWTHGSQNDKLGLNQLIERVRLSCMSALNTLRETSLILGLRGMLRLCPSASSIFCNNSTQQIMQPSRLHVSRSWLTRLRLSCRT